MEWYETILELSMHVLLTNSLVESPLLRFDIIGVR